jgi:hypothetical protein
MATRLFSDLLSGAGQRYFFDLDSTPGICSPGVGSITLGGYEPQYPGLAFRTPATLTLTINGRTPNQGIPLSPAQAALSFSNSVVGLQIIRLITPTLASPVESPDNVFVPTLIQVFHREPPVGVMILSGLQPSLSEGGDIGFKSPGVATLSLIGYPYLRSIPPVDGQATPLGIAGLEPTLVTETLIEPGVAALTFTASALGSVDKGFVWIDDDPAPPLTWT